MKDLNLALRLKYDGKAVTTGTAKNVRDLKAIHQAVSTQTKAHNAAQKPIAKQTTALKAVVSETQQASVVSKQLATVTQKQTTANKTAEAAQTSHTASLKQQVNKSADAAKATTAAKQAVEKQTIATQKAAKAHKTVAAAVSASAKENAKSRAAINKHVDANKRLGASNKKVVTEQLKVNAASAQAANTIQKVPIAITQQVAANSRLVSSNNRVQQSQASVVRSSRVMSNAYASITAAMAGVVGIGSGAMFVRDTGNAQLLDTRLKGLTGSAREYNAVQNYLFTTADKLNTSYTTLADSYSKILNLQEAGVVTQSQGVQILEGFANAAAKTGAGNEQLKQSLFGMTQGMTAGVLRAEELNQVTEPLPGLMQKLDKAAGTAAGGFRQLVNDGRITSQMFKRYLIKALNDYAGAAEATEGKINASFAEMGNEYQRLIREYEKPVNFAVTSVVSSITSAMSELRENKELVSGLTKSATALAVVIGSHLIGSLSKSATGFAANAIAKNRALQADLALAAQQKRLAVQQNQFAIQNKLAAQRQLEVAHNTALRAKAVTQLALANHKATASQTALTAATNTYTSAASRASVAARAASGAMALMGGPVGAAMMAGLAIAYFATQGDEGARSASDLKSRVNELAGGFEALTDKARAARLVQVNRTFESTSEQIANAKKEIQQLKHEVENGILISNNSIFGMSQMARVSLSKQQIKESNDKITLQEAKVEKLIVEQNRLLKLQKKLKGDVAKPKPTVKKPEVTAPAALPENIRRLQVSLLDEEGRIKHSYEKRKKMLVTARENDTANAAKYNQILAQLDAKHADDLNKLKQKKEADKTRIQNEAEQKRRNDLRNALEARIAQAKGFATREALTAYNTTLQVEQARQQARVDAKRRSQLGLAANDGVGELKYNADNEIKALERQQELNLAQGFHNQREADEAAHQERLMQIRSRNTGPLQAQIMAFANWEKQTALEKTSAVIGLGEVGLKAMSQQSKTAFKMYKAFAISNALIKTYESATSAYSALAWIKPIGPVLGAAAAAAAISMGMQRVRAIKSQQPAGIAHGGLDYVPNESTYILQRGERVLSPKQNIEISSMARRYNAGSQANSGASKGNISFNITNQIVVQGTQDDTAATRTGENIGRQITALILNDIQENGVIIKSIRNAA
ncbi:tape measure protein [Pseudoalteromonas sp. MMG013]|uniref:tape measure protein n=1 Tax=Pseudoalteromonas sp. MMG013 TaxID=2822687 RepID=UPI001B38208C|nr:tape measure protein [Pseudoalteromonas sp. MMG013]MBQ4864378.1 tape measure protein [Pseudoalteromonas sp. MMG013]